MSRRDWDPIEKIASLREAMGRMLEESLIPVPAQITTIIRGEKPPVSLPLDAYTTADEVVIIATVPGVAPNDVEILLEGDTLTIQGAFKPLLENINYLLQERAHGKFSRTVIINVPVDVDKAKTTFENGVLTLVLPKSQEARPKVIKVNRQSSGTS
jgi:HSP20 family protein